MKAAGALELLAVASMQDRQENDQVKGHHFMPGAQSEPNDKEPTAIGLRPRARYIVLRREDAWFIIFAGEEFGPYKSDREAKLFAIDAAYKLGEQGENSEVLMANESGALGPLWISGRDPYPPRE